MIASILGVVLGSLPGFHPNLILNFFSGPDLFLVVFGSLFSAVIPALLMVPVGEMSPVLLLGQSATKEGKMQDAVSDFAGGALLGSALFMVFMPLYSIVILAKGFISFITPYFLSLTIFITLKKSRNPKSAFLVFLVSGLYGSIILNTSLDINSVLGIHFASMFGLVGLWLSDSLPNQKVGPIKSSFDFIPSFVGTLGGLLISLFPAITPAQVYAVLLMVFGIHSKGLSAAGALSTSSFLFSFQSLIHLGKGRMASVEVIKFLPYSNFLIYAVISYMSVMVLSGLLVRMINYIPNLKVFSIGMVLLVMLAFYKDAGIIAIFSFFLGFLPFFFGVERVHLMGSLLLPTLIYYLH